MKNKLKDYFNFTNSERKGTLTLVVLLLLVVSGYWFKNFFVSSKSIEFISLDTDLQTLVELEKNQNQKKPDIKVEYFDFNPNEIGLESWQRLGFSEKQALSIVKYRDKGAYFYKKEDLKKLYVINDSLYAVLEPYIKIENKEKAIFSKETCFYVKIIEDTLPIYDKFSEIDKVICNRKQGVYSYYSGGYVNEKEAIYYQEKVQDLGFMNTEVSSLPCDFGFPINNKISEKTLTSGFKNNGPTNSLKSELKNFKIDINTADTTLFKSLKGIGSYYSTKIIKYREALGGFLSINQLKEVYGMQPEVIEQNLHRLTIDTSQVFKININTCEVTEIKKHPYISWNIANSIVQIRKNRGLYKSVKEINKSDLVNDEIYRKIAPYLKIN